MILAFVCTNGAHALYEKSKINTRENLGIEDAEYRREFCSPGMKEDRDEWSDSCLSFLEKVERDSVYFPIPESVADQTLTVSYVDSGWPTENIRVRAGMKARTLWQIRMSGDSIR